MPARRKPSDGTITKHSKYAKKQKTESTTKEQTGRNISKSVITKQVKDLGNGTTVTTEEKDVSFIHTSLSTKITEEVERNYIEYLQNVQSVVLNQSPRNLIDSNICLNMKFHSILKSCRSLKKWGEYASHKNDICGLFQHKPDCVEGIEFLVEYSWHEIMQYGHYLYEWEKKYVEEYDNTDLSDFPSETMFINDFMMNCFFDKAVFYVWHDNTQEVIWPSCSSAIGDIYKLEISGKPVNMVKNLSFTFPFNNKLATSVQGYTFHTSENIDIPLDFLLILEDGKRKYKEELDENRNILLSNMHEHPGVRHVISSKLNKNRSNYGF